MNQVAKELLIILHHLQVTARHWMIPLQKHFKALSWQHLICYLYLWEFPLWVPAQNNVQNNVQMYNKMRVFVVTFYSSAG